MDVRREPGYWSHEEARWIIHSQADADVAAAAADESANGARGGVDRPGATVMSAGQATHGPDTERGATLIP